MIFHCKHLAGLLTALLLVLSLGLQAQDMKQKQETSEDAFRLVRNTVNDVLKILSDRKISETEQRDKVYNIISERINFQSMSRRIMATNWKKTSEKQKQEFQYLFREILLESYWTRIRRYTDERVEYITGAVDKDNYATVDTIIVTESVEIPISYRMERIDGKWMAYDFLVESLSLVVNFRVEYRNIIKLFGIDGLLEHMKREVANFKI
ncbi:MAG: ABC transporter substrate-binding protein [Gammaproteobacteria bacterium]|nr:ABC transporter substrate-binding protein [Gammaproteobacteria bacterium]